MTAGTKIEEGSARDAGEGLRQMTAAKRRVALLSMLAALAMTILKLAAGLLSGSLGVLSDAAHSGLTDHSIFPASSRIPARRQV